MPHTRLTRPPCPSRRAFTLVEMMVVIGIIVILVTITLGVANAVVEGGRKRATEGVLRALDQTMDIYIDKQGEIPPPLVAVPPNRLVGGGPLDGQTMYYPLIDGVVQASNGAPFLAIDSVGIYMFAAEQVPEVQSIVAGLDSRFVVRAQAAAAPERAGSGGGGANASNTQPLVELTSVLDAWGNPIRIVHPRFDSIIVGSGQFGSIGILPTTDASDGYFTASELPRLGGRYMPFRRIRRLAPTEAEWRDFDETTIRENFANGVGDSDGGACPSPRPYFYSAGPDGDPATIDDNVYTTRPRFPEPE
jgi:prepilin-type N-terminal cleavage/methylation domain-containing protein